MAAKVNSLLVYLSLLCVALTTYGQNHGQLEIKEVDIGIRFNIEPTDVVIARGKSAILHCLAESMMVDEKIRIDWTYNDRKIEYDSRRFLHQNGSLIFNKVLGKRKDIDSDEGIYRCVASISNAILISRPAELKIAVFPREFDVLPKEKVVFQGDTVRLVCNLKSIPPADISWTLNNGSLAEENLRFKYNTLVTGVLYISDIQPSDSGEYRCIAKNWVLKRSRRSNPYALVVQSKKADATSSMKLEFLSPRFSKIMFVKQNEQLILDCSVSGPTNEINIFWTYSPTELDKKVVLTNASAGINIFKKDKTGIEDSGFYTCIASPINTKSDVHSISQVVKVDVITPPVLKTRPKSKQSPSAFRVRFECEATGHPKPEIFWLHNGKQIHINGRIKQSENELILINTVTSDSGIYQCIAINQYGSTWAAGHLFVIGSSQRPDPPAGLTCTPLNSTQILVSWETNDNSEQPPIVIRNNFETSDAQEEDDVKEPVAVLRTIMKAYSIHYFPTDGGEELQELSVNQSITLSRLQPNKNYTIYVRTYNGVSGSDQSEQITCHTPEEDEAFQIVANVIESKSIDLKWDVRNMKLRTKDVNSVTYKIKWKVKGANDDDVVGEADVTSTSYTINDLKPGTHYEVRVVATVGDEAVLESNWESVSIPFIPIMTAPILNLIIVNSTCLQAMWKTANKFKFDSIKISCTKEGSGNPSKIAILPPDQKSFFFSELEPGEKYEVSLIAVSNSKESDPSRKIISMPLNRNANMEILVPPSSLRGETLSSSSILLTWMPPVDTKVAFYVVEYQISDTSSNFESQTSENNSIILESLQPDKLYGINIRAFGYDETYSPKCDTIYVRTLKNPPGAVDNIKWQPINSTSLRISWDKPTDTNSLLSYAVSYTSIRSTPTQLWTTVPVPEGASSVILSNLKTNREYSVMIQPRSEIAGNGEPKIITVSVSKIPPPRSSQTNSLSTFTLSSSNFSNDQWHGVYVGIGIGIVCLVLSGAFLYIFKRRYENRKLTMQRQRTHFLGNEMIPLPKNSNGCNKPYMNGGVHNVTIQMPLLPPTSNISNNDVAPNLDQTENSGRTENSRFFVVKENDETSPEETNALLLHSHPKSDLFAVKTTTAMPNINPRIPNHLPLPDLNQEECGGDSGFCDRRNSPSPKLSNCKIFAQKYSNIINKDEGFCDNNNSSQSSGITTT